MKRILAGMVLLLLILLMLLTIGCKKEVRLDVEIAEEDVKADISEVDALAGDLEPSELEELDSLIEELESDQS